MRQPFSKEWWLQKNWHKFFTAGMHKYAIESLAHEGKLTYLKKTISHKMADGFESNEL